MGRRYAIKKKEKNAAVVRVLVYAVGQAQRSAVLLDHPHGVANQQKNVEQQLENVIQMISVMMVLLNVQKELLAAVHQAENAVVVADLNIAAIRQVLDFAVLLLKNVELHINARTFAQMEKHLALPHRHAVAHPAIVSVAQAKNAALARHLIAVLQVLLAEQHKRNVLKPKNTTKDLNKH